MWNFRQIVPRPESFRHCRLLESKRVERGGREGRRRETRVLVSISPEPKGPKAVGLVLAPLAGAPNRSVVGGSPTHNAIKRGVGVTAQITRLTAPPSPTPKPYRLREHWSAGKLRRRPCSVPSPPQLPQARMLPLSTPEAVLHLTACRRRPCIDNEPRHGQGSDRRRWSASIPFSVVVVARVLGFVLRVLA
jgi:hypothetical protein